MALPIPQPPVVILDVMNLRGTIVPVVDIAFTEGRRPDLLPRHVVVASLRDEEIHANLRIGIAADEVRRYGLDPGKRARLVKAGAHLIIPDYTQALKTSLKGRRLGVITETFGEGLDPPVRSAIEKALEQLQELGAEVRQISCPRFAYGLPTYYIIAPSEASSNLARYDGVKYGYRSGDAASLAEMTSRSRSEGFGDEVKRRILIGTYVLSHGYYDAYYLQAQKLRRMIADDFQQCFRQCDLIAGPVAPTVAWKLGAQDDDPVKAYLADIFTLPDRKSTR